MKITNEEAITDLKKLKCFHNGSYAPAINKAIKELSADKWIPVSERLPEYEEEVLCQLEDGMAVLYREDDWGQDVWVDGGIGTGTYEVVAWQPLPEPYKESK